MCQGPEAESGKPFSEKMEAGAVGNRPGPCKDDCGPGFCVLNTSSQALGFNCLSQEAELKGKLPATGRKTGETGNGQQEDQKSEGNRNYAAALKDKKEQRSKQASTALEATARWDVGPCNVCVCVMALLEP